MKKTLSIFLSALMVLSIFSCLSVTTFATEPELVSFSFELAEEKSAYKYTDGYWSVEYDADEEAFKKTYYYQLFSIWDTGNKITLGYSDGTSVEYICDEDAWFYDELGNQLNEDTLGYWDNQNKTPWEPGTNYVYVEYEGLECEVPVVIYESPLDSVEFIPAKEIELLCDIDGYEEVIFDGPNEGETYFYYPWLGLFEDGNKLVLNYKDGTTEVYESDSYDFYDEYENLLETDYLSVCNTQHTNPWAEPGEYSFEMYYMGCGFRMPVTVIETPVQSIEYIPAQPHTMIENTGGYYVWCESDSCYENGEEYYYYEYYNAFPLDGDKLVITYKDGKILEYVSDGYEFYDDEGNDPEYEVSFNTNQIDAHWRLGENTVEVEYAGLTTEITVEILENPVESIEYVPVSPYTIIENTNGNYDWCDCGECIENGSEYFNYDFYEVFPISGDKLIVTHKDGTTYEYISDGYDFYDDLGTESEYEVLYYTNQYEKHWALGENTAEIEYMGVRTDLAVEIIENPIASISVSPQKVSYYEFTNGSWSYYNDEDGNEVEYFHYDNPLIEDGSSITVTYVDGSSEVYYYDVYEDDYLNADGKALAGRVNIDCEDQPWVVGEYTYTVEYCNRECTSTVKIVENPIESIEFTAAKPLTFQAEVDGRWGWSYDYELDEEVQFFHYDIDKYSPCEENNTLVVNYKNGRSDSFVYNEARGTFVNKKGSPITSLYDVNYLDVQYYQPWNKDSVENFIIVEFMGRYTYVPVIIEDGIPGAPVIEGVYNDAGKIIFAWEQLPGATEYRVYRRGAGEKYWTYLDTTADLYYEDTNVKADAYYRYTVRSVNSHGFGGFDANGIVIRYIAPVKNIKAVNTVGGIQVTWTAYPGAVCQVYRRAAGQSEWEYLGEAPGSGYYVEDTDVNNTTYYRYAVLARKGNYISGVDMAKTALVKCVETPSLTGISNAASGIYIKWNAVAGATGYRVYRRGAGQTTWTYLGTTKNLWYVDNAVKNSNGNYYRYTVRAVSYNTFSGFDTNGLYIKRLANPALTSAKSSSAGITVKWNAITGSTGYNVYRKTATSGWVRVGTTSGVKNTTFLDKTAQKGVTYTYTVRACSGYTLSSYNSGISCKDLY